MPILPSLSQNVLIKVPQFTVGVGLALFCGVFAAGAAFWFAPGSYHEVLVFFAATVAAAGQLAAAFYAARVLAYTAQINQQISEVAAQNRSEDLQHARVERASQFSARWNDPTMFHVRQNCQKLIDCTGKQEEILKLINADENSQTNVRHILNFLEELSASIHENACDEALAKRLFCGIVLKMWHQVDFYIREHRLARGRPAIWADLERLYDSWKA